MTEYGLAMTKLGLSVQEMEFEHFANTILEGQRFGFLMTRPFTRILNGAKKFREMDDIIGLRFHSDMVPYHSALEQRLNILMQRLFEHGFYLYLDGLNNRMEYETYRKEMLQLLPGGDSDQNPNIPGAMIWVWVYVGFCGCCVVTFIAEIVFGRFLKTV